MKRSESTEYVKYQFTKDERNEMSLEAVREIQEREQAENDLKSIKSQFKSKIDGLSARILELTNKVNNGWEMRNVKCRLSFDYYDRKVRFYAIEGPSGEGPVKERRMTLDEYEQREIPFEPDDVVETNQAAFVTPKTDQEPEPAGNIDQAMTPPGPLEPEGRPDYKCPNCKTTWRDADVQDWNPIDVPEGKCSLCSPPGSD